MLYIDPNLPNSKVHFKSRYGNFIGGNWVAPINLKTLVEQKHKI